MKEPEVGSLLHWGQTAANDPQLKSDGVIKPRAIEVAKLGDSLMQTVDRCEAELDDIDAEIAKLEDEIHVRQMKRAKVEAKLKAYVEVIERMGTAPTEAAPKATRKRTQQDPTSAMNVEPAKDSAMKETLPIPSDNVTSLHQPAPPAASKKRETLRHPSFTEPKGDGPSAA